MKQGSSRMKSGLLGDMPVSQPPSAQTPNPPPQQVTNQPPLNRLSATSSMPDMSRGLYSLFYLQLVCIMSVWHLILYSFTCN